MSKEKNNNNRMPNLNFYIPYLSKPWVDKTALVTEVLSRFEYKDLVRFKKMMPKVFHGLLKLPKLRRKNFGDIIKKGKTIWTDVVDIYGTLTFIIQQNADVINRYIELKEKLDTATVLRQYGEAYAILKQIETEISVSMTGTYYRLKLTRQDKGINASSQLYNTICQENDALTYISQIALKSASVDMPFEAEIELAYKNLKAPEDVKGLFVAFAFPYMAIEGSKWMRLLSLTSIIDLYEGFILQLNKLEPEELQEEHLKELIEILASDIHDEKLERLNTMLHYGQNGNESSPNEDAKDIIEQYYKGEYKEVVQKGEAYLKKNPLNSTILDLYNRSCIRMGLIETELYPEDSLASRLSGLSLMGSLNEEFSEMAKSQLRNLCMAWYTIPCMRHLYNLYVDIETTRTGSVYHRFWAYSPVAEVRDSCFFETMGEALDYLRASGYQDGISSQIDIVEQKIEDKYNQTYRLLKGLEISDVEPLREAVEKGLMMPVLTDAVVSQLFDRLTAEARYDEAISMYVSYKLKAPHSRIYLDRQRIGIELTDETDKNIHNQQELAAFYTMISGDTYKRYLAYKRYLKEQSVKKASDIEGGEGDLYLYFIGKVADRSVLMLHVRAFDTDDDVNTERIELCKKAFAISNDKSYTDEITSLIKEQEIKTLAQQVNDSKIHVDVQPLISSELDTEKLMFDTYKEVDENIEVFEQKNIEWLLDYIQEQREGTMRFYKYEPSAVKYKMLMFRQMVLNIRDKFLFDPRFGLDKYLSARIRHGTLITQLRNHFLTYGLVTNKKEGGEYVRESVWTQKRGVNLPDDVKEQVNTRLLQFTEWLDEQLRIIKEEKIQILTERNDDKKEGLFNYSEELMAPYIDMLGDDIYETFDAFVHTTIKLLWDWTNAMLKVVRDYFTTYQESVLTEMDKLENDILPLISQSTQLANSFRDAITTCRTEFQADINIVLSWFKPERSKVRFFAVQQAVDTSLSVINRINQNALSFNNISIDDSTHYKGDYFNAVHDIFHDMMNNILRYETKRPELKGKGEIHITREGNMLNIEVSNPVDEADIPEIEAILLEQQDFPSLIAGGKTRREKNSGCVKIYSTVMYTLGGESQYENQLENNCFVAKIQIDTKKLLYNEDTVS